MRAITQKGHVVLPSGGSLLVSSNKSYLWAGVHPVSYYSQGPGARCCGEAHGEGWARWDVYSVCLKVVQPEQGSGSEIKKQTF